MANLSGETPLGTAWDENFPTDGDAIGLSFAEIRDLRMGTRIRMEKEHVIPAASSVGGEHVQGSARAYVRTTAEAPAHRPYNSTTDLNGEDVGRLWFDTTISMLKSWSGSAWTTLSHAGLANLTTGDPHTQYLAKAGGTMTGAIAMGGQKITGLAAGTVSGDAVRYDEAVRLTENQTVLGVKTFYDLPKTQSGNHASALEDLVNKSYLDTRLTALMSPDVYAGQETIVFSNGFKIKQGTAQCVQNVATHVIFSEEFSVCTNAFCCWGDDVTGNPDAPGVYGLEHDGLYLMQRGVAGTRLVRWFAIGY